MSLVNYTLPFGSAGNSIPNWATISPLQQHATAVNNLLYGPAGHEESDLPPDQDYYENNPYAPPQRPTQQQYRNRNNNYLPPPPASQQQQQQQQQHQHSSIPQQFNTVQQYQQQTISTQQQHHQQQQQQQTHSTQQSRNQYQQHTQPTRTYGDEGSYSAKIPPREIQPPNTQQQYFNSFNSQQRISYNSQQSTVSATVSPVQPTVTRTGGKSIISGETKRSDSSTNIEANNAKVTDSKYPNQVPGFTRVHAGHGSRTQVHAVLDYDDDEGDYYDEKDDGDPVGIPAGHRGSSMPTVTPIQGPIFIKNGSVPVVPLFSYPTTNNGSFVQIPIWWTALSVALGLEISGDVIRGTPCVKRYNQLFCPTAGNTYPIDRIESFIDENKALMRRMYGDFEIITEYGPPKQQNQKEKRNSASDIPLDPVDVPGTGLPLEDSGASGDSYFSEWRAKRQANQSFGGKNSRNSGSSSTKPNIGPNPASEPNTGRVDACESKIEIVTPYWASNSAGKIRAVVNTQHFEQAIHQEVCVKMQTNRCGGDCGCEQKYKWHRLLAYDPDNDCKGIFMDWFLFPSCCVCRCTP